MAYLRTHALTHSFQYIFEVNVDHTVVADKENMGEHFNCLLIKVQWKYQVSSIMLLIMLLY